MDFRSQKYYSVFLIVQKSIWACVHCLGLFQAAGYVQGTENTNLIREGIVWMGELGCSSPEPLWKVSGRASGRMYCYGQIYTEYTVLYSTDRQRSQRPGQIVCSYRGSKAMIDIGLKCKEHSKYSSSYYIKLALLTRPGFHQWQHQPFRILTSASTGGALKSWQLGAYWM